MLRKSPPSALILDLRYPASLRWKLCREIARSAPGVPFVILSTHSDIKGKILLLEIGADDYMPLPFQPRELLARLRSVIRRATRAGGTRIYAFENVLVDFVRMDVTRGGEKVDLQQMNSKRWSSGRGMPTRSFHKTSILMAKPHWSRPMGLESDL